MSRTLKKRDFAETVLPNEKLQACLGTLALFDFDRLFWLYQSLPRRRNWGLI